MFWDPEQDNAKWPKQIINITANCFIHRDIIYNLAYLQEMYKTVRKMNFKRELLMKFLNYEGYYLNLIHNK